MTESFEHPSTLAELTANPWPLFWIDVTESAGVEDQTIGIIAGRGAIGALATASSPEAARYVVRALRAYAQSEAGLVDPDRPT